MTIAPPNPASLAFEWRTALMTPGTGPDASRADGLTTPGPGAAVPLSFDRTDACCSAPSGLISPNPMVVL